MTRVIGIDPGTLSFDLCGLEDGHLFLDETIASPDVSADPTILTAVLDAARPLDFVIAPSGYGLPWVPVDVCGERELFLFMLADDEEDDQNSGIGGLRALVQALQATHLPIVFMPGVIHLPTVPVHRKANKLDLGTADKLCCAALGVYDQARHWQVAYQQTNFIYVEVGGAFTAVLAVREGQVVDGLGGSNGAPGFYALGAMDGELAYLLGNFRKHVLFSGGVAYMAGKPNWTADEAAARRHTENTVASAWEAFFEGVVKAVAAELTIVPQSREILLSGRLCRTPTILAELTERLSIFAPVRRISGFAHTTKEAAQGAALIADGMAGGQFADLVDSMRLREAQGTILDYIYIDGADALRRSLKLK